MEYIVRDSQESWSSIAVQIIVIYWIHEWIRLLWLANISLHWKKNTYKNKFIRIDFIWNCEHCGLSIKA